MANTNSTSDHIHTRKSESTYDRMTELKAFDDSKAGVKGLVDAGITKIPRIFHFDPKILSEKSVADSKFTVPVIDLEGIHGDSILRDRVVRKARDACRNWGVFQVVNHGIPTEMLDDMIEGIRRFHELETEVKKEFYSRDLSRKVVYLSNYGLYRNQAASWLDSLGCFMAPHPPKPEAMPAVCRCVVIKTNEYTLILNSNSAVTCLYGDFKIVTIIMITKKKKRERINTMLQYKITINSNCGI